MYSVSQQNFVTDVELDIFYKSIQTVELFLGHVASPYFLHCSSTLDN